MHRVVKCKINGQKPTVLFNVKGQPYGVAAVEMQSYIGVLARTKAPIWFDTWRQVPVTIKNKIWKSVTSANSKWKQFKSTLTCRYIIPFRDEPEKLRTPLDDFSFLEKNHWDIFVFDRLSPEFLKVHDEHVKRVEENKYPHRLSRKGYANLEQEWEFLREQVCSGVLTEEGDDDVLTKALGKPEHGGRVRGQGMHNESEDQKIDIVEKLVEVRGLKVEKKAEKDVFVDVDSGESQMAQLDVGSVDNIVAYAKVYGFSQMDDLTLHEVVYYMDPLKRRIDSQEWTEVVDNAIVLYKNTMNTPMLKKKVSWENMAVIPMQKENVDCGFFVMRYMKEICQDKEVEFASKWARRGNLEYTEDDINQTKVEFANSQNFSPQESCIVEICVKQYPDYSCGKRLRMKETLAMTLLEISTMPPSKFISLALSVVSQNPVHQGFDFRSPPGILHDCLNFWSYAFAFNKRISIRVESLVF
ncbi:unnamed protein product [Cuscuta campestris]|uniref:Ubiquitin-like protease family profile domain-containing protein n=1 Tax=Cuscuta campestris TaxID=132261 RepID=A0A484MPP5_9ASTE|nr:unnamed protein product [Cuscuta campestris]